MCLQVNRGVKMNDAGSFPSSQVPFVSGFCGFFFSSVGHTPRSGAQGHWAAGGGSGWFARRFFQ